MIVRTIFGSIRRAMKVSWIRTIYFNFRYLPFEQAIYLPILLYNPGRTTGKGKILLNVKNEDVKFGMIKLGMKHEECILSKVGITICNHGTIEFKGSGLLGNGSSIIVEKSGNLILGNNFGITGNLNLHCNDMVSIGCFFSCSWDVCIDDSDHHRLFEADTMNIKPMSKPIEIKDYVWLCQRTMVLKGSVIPSWCTIAAYSLVNKKLPPPTLCLSTTDGVSRKNEVEVRGCVYAGIPARLMKTRVIRQDLNVLSQIVDYYITKNI